MLLAFVAVGCVANTPNVREAPSPSRGNPLRFTFVDPAGNTISSETMQGRPTIAALVTTYDWASQLVLRRVNRALGSYVPRINAFAVILEPPSYGVLAPAFAESLSLRFPVVMADQASLDGGGPLGPIDYVPTLVVLDPAGRVVDRLKGLVEADQIKAALDRASGVTSQTEIQEP